ncbi:hypothetical protein CB172_13355 [Salmonella enterica subsp. enterica serovar Claibornei]|nr:hypothetical protein [Salmonella enterica subsp. enterica serovar Claibornei]
MLRFREFQAVRSTDCLPKQEILRGIVPPLGIDLLLLFFLLTAACQLSGMWRSPDVTGLAAVCCAASLCATKVTPCLVQGVDIAFLVQDDDDSVRCVCTSPQTLLRPGIAEVRTGKRLVILINQGLLSDREAKGCPKA